ncbi:MAG: adenine phosphoribosyltransferase [Paludibacteraceae bacterium]|nr:adenine phosphoribosyltransferase [Paludibacteraceae bacterium]
MTHEQFKSLIRNVPDFPKQGIQFKDITTAMKDAECLKWIRDEVTNLYRDKGITQVVGLESRGFIIGPAVAMELGAGFVLARKPGKLPADVISATYNKEYGTDTIQLHRDALTENDVVLIHDDLLATGGSIDGAIKLVKKAGVKKIYVNFLIELNGLNGRDLIDKDIEVTSLVQF